MEIKSFQVESKGKTSLQKLPTKSEIQAWIISYLARLLQVDSSQIDDVTPFDRYGLDSSAAIDLTGDLEIWLGQDIDPTLLYDYPTIEALVTHLAEELECNHP
ncbi:acyl carrier protein [Pleurocapsa sp. PCC 7319]|uniref:acyl carrier protein n=1 Tax=Pleurocapsa sp. PCC 7319 TaxID=118161 RepID=UPI00034517E2|nr:acyl carrier protein [Pleurocapsa sp. PCC 7319]